MHKTRAQVSKAFFLILVGSAQSRPSIIVGGFRERPPPRIASRASDLDLRAPDRARRLDSSPGASFS